MDRAHGAATARAFHYDVFVVHAKAEERFVQGYLLAELGLAPERVLVLDELALGRPIIEEIERGVRTSRATIVVLSPAYMTDRWAVFGEQLVSYTCVASGHPGELLPILRADCDLPAHIRTLVTLDFRDSNPDVWKSEAARLRTHLDKPAPADPEIPCPYPGIRPFTELDASRFFGREAELADITGRLRRGEREIYVIGASGSGKSSLVAAGLIPRLTSTAGPGGLVVRTMCPGEQPSTRLAQVLEGDASAPATAILKLLERHPPAASLLLVVDQLEELFTIATTDEHLDFLEALRALRANPRCVLVFTLRADFFGAFMESGLWTDLDGRISRLELGALRGDRLRAVIERPARDLGVYLEPELVESLLADTADEPGALPLLQETLFQLWGRRRRRLLTRVDYEALGDATRSGLALAISDRADTTLRTLTRAQEATALRILLRLVNFGEGRADTRRQQPRTTLRAMSESTADFDVVFQRLVDDRLVTITGDDHPDTVRVDLAHEVLIHAWPTFADWIQTWRAHEQLRRELEAAAVTWRVRGSGDGGLLDTIEHADVIVWRTEAARQLGESAELTAFIAASAAMHARVIRQRRRRIRVATTTLALFLVIASVLALAAYNQRSRAEAALASAEKRKRELVRLQAETSLPKDPTATLAWLKLYDGGPADRGTVVDVIDEALALGVARHVFRTGDWVYDAQFTPDGTTLVVLVRDGVIRTYDLGTGFEADLGQAPSPPEHMVLSRDGALAITGGTLGEVIAWPVHGGPPRVLVEAGGQSIAGLRLSPEDRLLVERESSAPQVLSLAGGEPELLGPTSGLRFAVAGDDWSRVVMMTSANEVAVPLRGGVVRLAHTNRAIAKIAISPRGDTVLVHDGATLWSVPFAGGPLRELARYAGLVATVVWSPDGQTIAIGGSRPEILLVDAATATVTELRGHSDAIYTLAFTRDGTRLLSASDDSTARVWRLSNRTAIVLRGHDDDVLRARFSADERRVATSSLDGSVRVWALDRPSAATLVEGEPIEDIKFEGDRVLARTSTAIARWNLATGQREPLFSWANEAHNLGYDRPSLDGEHLVVPNADGSMELRRRTGPSLTLHGHRGLITHVEFTRDGRTMFSSSSDGTPRRWDVATGAGTTVLQGATPIRGFAVARDGRVAAHADDELYLIASSGEVRRLGKGSAWCIESAEFDPAKDRLILHRCDKSLAIIDDHKIIELATGRYMAGRVAASPDGRLIAAGVIDRTIRLWDAESGQLIDILRGHSDGLPEVAFSPDGHQLASASYDKTIRIWDLRSKRHRVLRGHTARVLRIAWRSAGQVVAGSLDGTIRLWDVPSLEPSAAAIVEQLNVATTARIVFDRPVSGQTSLTSSRQ